MTIRKYIIAVFIVFSVSFSFQPANVFVRQKEAVVFILDFSSDFFTNHFINRNETKRNKILVSLTIQVLINEKQKKYFNSS